MKLTRHSQTKTNKAPEFRGLYLFLLENVFCGAFDIFLYDFLDRLADFRRVADKTPFRDGDHVADLLEREPLPLLVLGLAVLVPEELLHFRRDPYLSAFVVDGGVRHGAGEDDGGAPHLCADGAAQLARLHQHRAAVVVELPRRPFPAEEAFPLEVAVELIEYLDPDVGEYVVEKLFWCHVFSYFCGIV